MEHTTIRRLPRAGIDPIDHPDTALATIAMAVSRPLQSETILLLLDGARCGRSIVVVSGTPDPDHVIDIVETVTRAEGCEHIGALVVASVRPGTGDPPGDAPSGDDRIGDDLPGDDLSGDVDRWLEMSDLASLVGIELLEWFVIGRTISCPRDRLGESPRW